MGNTKRQNSTKPKTDRISPWPFRPNLPAAPRRHTPEALASHERDLADLTELYAFLEQAANRGGLMRELMLEAFRARREDLAELRELAQLGSEWREHFGDIAPGQLAQLFDRLSARAPVAGPASEGAPPVPSPASSAEERKVRLVALASSLPDDDPMAGELG